VGFGAKCVRDAFLFSTATRPAPGGGRLGLLGSVPLELRRSMLKLPTHCHLAARLCPASRPPLLRCHAVAHKQKEGRFYFLASLHFSFLSTALQNIVLVSFNPQLRGLDSFQHGTIFMNNKFIDLECSCVFCVETNNKGNFRSTNFRIFTQSFFYCGPLISNNVQYFRQIKCGEGTACPKLRLNY